MFGKVVQRSLHRVQLPATTPWPLRSASNQHGLLSSAKRGLQVSGWIPMRPNGRPDWLHPNNQVMLISLLLAMGCANLLHKRRSQRLERDALEQQMLEDLQASRQVTHPTQASTASKE